MLTAIKVSIENDQILSEYAKLLQAMAAKNSSAQTKITTGMERIFAETLFRGVTIRSGAGEGNPDFKITNDDMNLLLNSMTRAGDEMDNFNNFVSQGFATSGNTIEAKIMRSNSDKDIKLGVFAPTEKADSLQYTDFISGNIIDTTRFSVVQQLRASYTEDGLNKPQLNKPLPKELKNADLSAFIKKASPDFQLAIKDDQNVSNLNKILAKGGPGVQSSAQISTLVDKINDTWAQKTIEAELTRLTKAGKLFDHIKKVPALDSRFYSKSRIISIIRSDNGKANALMVFFPYSHFNNKFFDAKYEEGNIKVFIKSSVEKIFNEQLATSTAALTLGNSLDDYDKAVKELAASGKFVKVPVSTFNTEIKYLVPTGGSIPMSTGNFFSVKRKYKRPPFIRTGNETIGKYKKEAEYMPDTFLSSEFLSLLVRKKVVESMPHGPIGGRPLSTTKLTYRTGRFANSIQLLVNYRSRIVQYYYNPIYYVHEMTSRDPQKLITQSINEVLREKFSQKFNIVHSRG